MNALLIITHGSRRGTSNMEVLEHTLKLTELAGNKFNLVKAYILQLAESSIDAAIEDCAEQGIKSIIVLPYFFCAGRHIEEEVPQALTKYSRKWPQLCISVRSHVGTLDTTPTLLLNTAMDHGDSYLSHPAQPLMLDRGNTHDR